VVAALWGDRVMGLTPHDLRDFGDRMQCARRCGRRNRRGVEEPWCRRDIRVANAWMPGLPPDLPARGSEVRTGEPTGLGAGGPGSRARAADGLAAG